MQKSLAQLANRTLRGDISLPSALLFEEDSRGRMHLVLDTAKKRTICTFAPETLAPIADQEILAQIVNTIWDVAAQEFQAGRTAGIAAERAWQDARHAAHENGTPFNQAPPDYRFIF